MICIVVVSHSKKLAEGVKEICLMMNPNTPIYAIGGSYDGSLGTDYERIKDTIKSIYSNDGIIILYDVGSAKMTSEMVIDELKQDGLNKIKIFDVPLVEGCIEASFKILNTSNIDEIDLSIENLKKD